MDFAGKSKQMGDFYCDIGRLAKKNYYPMWYRGIGSWSDNIAIPNQLTQKGGGVEAVEALFLEF